MSLKPRSVDFNETWANLRETVSGVVNLKTVERGEWNMRFSDVYALCVAHPDPLADKLYEETKLFLEEHVKNILVRVKGNSFLTNNDHEDGLLTRYCAAWLEYSQGVSYLNNLYLYLNLQHVKRNKISEAEIIYGSAASAMGLPDQDAQLEVGELGLYIWEKELVRPLSDALTCRVVAALEKARNARLDPVIDHVLTTTIKSFITMQEYRPRMKLCLYSELVLTPYLRHADATHTSFAAQLLATGDVPKYMEMVVEGLNREVQLGARYLQASGAEAVRACYEQAAVSAHLDTLHAHCGGVMADAAGDGLHGNVAQRRVDLSRMFILLRPLGAPALKPLIDAAYQQATREGKERLAAPHSKDEAHVHFVTSVLAMHDKYSRLFAEVFNGATPFCDALDKACSAVVNTRDESGVTRAPELLARYCDALLRKKAAGAPLSDADADEQLAAAILVFKYVDDKDVFQKHYARTLARRLIHQLSSSMDQEEAMINRLKAACGYEFTNKLHRMFTDVAVSADLNQKFQHHLRETGQPLQVGFFVQVLQAGAWPLGGAMTPLAPPAQLERPARQFETFYRSSFSGRRLAWLHQLCGGELRTRYTKRVHLLSATTPQCALLLCFDTSDKSSAKELREALRLPPEAWYRHTKPLVDAGLLIAHGDLDEETTDTVLELNLDFSSKRSKVKITCLPPAPGSNEPAAGSSTSSTEATAARCEDDRKMYLQAAIVRIMKQRKILRHNELLQEVVQQARGSFAPSVAMIKKCIEALIDKQYLERAPATLDTYSYLALIRELCDTLS